MDLHRASTFGRGRASTARRNISMPGSGCGPVEERLRLRALIARCEQAFPLTEDSQSERLVDEESVELPCEDLDVR
jgi:hypothetical protein